MDVRNSLLFLSEAISIKSFIKSTVVTVNRAIFNLTSHRTIIDIAAAEYGFEAFVALRLVRAEAFPVCHLR